MQLSLVVVVICLASILDETFFSSQTIYAGWISGLSHQFSMSLCGGLFY